MDKVKIAGAAILIFVALAVFSIYKSDDDSSGLPSFAKKNRRVREAYEFAVSHPEVLEQYPCSCGCADLGHKSNRDCYVRDDGSFDTHGSLCGGCIGLTMRGKSLFEEGKSLDEIRKIVIKEYGMEDLAREIGGYGYQ